MPGEGYFKRKGKKHARQNKNYKRLTYPLTTAERTTLQEELFLLGYKWYESGQKVTDLDSDTLFLEKDMDITCGNKYDFNHYKYPILTVSDIMPQTITPSTLTVTTLRARRYLD